MSMHEYAFSDPDVDFSFLLNSVSSTPGRRMLSEGSGSPSLFGSVTMSAFHCPAVASALLLPSSASSPSANQKGGVEFTPRQVSELSGINELIFIAGTVCPDMVLHQC